MATAQKIRYKFLIIREVVLDFVSEGKNGGERRIRTFEGVRRQIYSLLPLATRASLHTNYLLRPTSIYFGFGGIRIEIIVNPTELRILRNLSALRTRCVPEFFGLRPKNGAGERA